MKNLLKTNRIFLLMLFFISTLLNGQMQDQWYVINGQPWTGSSYNSNNLLDGPILIKGIRIPKINCNSEAKDDIFIIFNDGSYYNSRFLSISGTGTSFVNGFVYSNINLNIPTADLLLSSDQKIKYLYATNKYDEDPLEEEISVINGNGQENPITYSNTLNNKIISANHDVVINRDITIVIDSNKIVNGYSKPFYLRYSKIISSTDTFQETGLFDPSPIFIDKAFLPFSSNRVETNYAYIKLFNDKGLVYLNLIPKEKMLDYTPRIVGGEEIVDSLLFELYDDNNELIAELKEAIRYSHDPNYIAATKICKSNNQEYVQYFCTFQNDFSISANKLKVRFKLPIGLDSRSLKVLNSYANGEAVDNVNINFLNDEIVELAWEDSISIMACENNNPDAGIVTVNFCVKKSENSAIDLTEISLKTENDSTYFSTNEHSTAYSLEYRDQICHKDIIETVSADSSKTKIKKVVCSRRFDSCEECAKSDPPCTDILCQLKIVLLKFWYLILALIGGLLLLLRKTNIR